MGHNKINSSTHDTSIGDSTPSSNGDRSSVGVRVIASLGILLVIGYETYVATTQGFSMNSWGHIVAAVGTLYFLSNALRHGRWRSPTLDTATHDSP